MLKTSILSILFAGLKKLLGHESVQLESSKATKTITNRNSLFHPVRNGPFLNKEKEPNLLLSICNRYRRK